MGRDDADLALAFGLAALAGAVDASGLQRLHDLYVSFMSGNTTSLAVAAGHGDWQRAATAGALVVLFVTGAALGEALALAAGRWHPPVVVLAVAAGLSAAAAAPAWTVPALVVSMGALNAAMSQAGQTGVSLTFVTGTLVRFGQGLGRLPFHRNNGWAWLRQMTPWCGLLAGALAAVAMQRVLGSSTLWPLPVAALALAGAAGAMAW